MNTADAFPGYDLVRELGRGGMGVVYLAKNKLMDRLEVLKVLNQRFLEQPDAQARFLREIRSAAVLHHPNIVTAYSALLQEDGQLVLAMEYVKGEDLAKGVRAGGPLPVVSACDYVRQAALGLEHACQKGIVHRDIHPGNLIRTWEGNEPIVKILDFGLAKATSEKETARKERQSTGSLLGVPLYMAPEQILYPARADIRADIYSLGCTLHFLLTGSPPFLNEGSLDDLLVAHLSKEARPLNRLRNDVHAELATVVAKMMAKAPGHRFQRPVEVAQALVPFAQAGPKRGEAWAFALGITADGGTTRSANPTGNPQVTLDTSMGTLKIELYPDKAPVTVKNFLDYVAAGHYDYTIFHCVIRDFMIQGGGFEPGMRQKRTRPPITTESGNGLKNERGSLAMARTSDPDSATSQFFINTVNNDFLNKASARDGVGYCVFAKVIEGMDVVDQIAAVPTGDKSGHQNVPRTDVVVRSAKQAWFSMLEQRQREAERKKIEEEARNKAKESQPTNFRVIRRVSCLDGITRNVYEDPDGRQWVYGTVGRLYGSWLPTKDE